ncbi:MAG: hypothetical protein IJ403_10700 [Oscillospiraceae bacterium]|nr:hypothetical protein [Oscillospiraceae bacterium]
MLLVFIIICVACIILQQFQLWQIRRTFRHVSDAAVSFLEDHPNEQRRSSNPHRR